MFILSYVLLSSRKKTIAGLRENGDNIYRNILLTIIDGETIINVTLIPMQYEIEQTRNHEKV